MIRKYESISKKSGEEKSKTIALVATKEEATHEHLCYHDELDGSGRVAKPCKRVELKK